MAKSEYEANLETLVEQAEAARSAVRLVPTEAREPNERILDRLEQVLSYSGVVLAASDPPLVSAQAHGALSTAFQRVQGEVATQPQTADQFANEVLEALSEVPVARGQLTAQEAKDAAKKFAQSAQGRLNALRTAVKQAKQRSDEIDSLVAAKQQEFEEAVEARKTEAEALVTATRGQLEGLEQRIEQAITEQAETFRESQTTNSTAFASELDEFKSALSRLITGSERQVEERVAEIKRMEEESSRLVGAIGLAGTAERYGEEVDQQRAAANGWRWMTVGVVIFAVAAAIWAAQAEDTDDPAFIGKLLISLALGALATYTARQSARHRRREETARQLQLDLTAFGPFIEPLPGDKQVEERIEMTRKSFGRPLLPDDKEHGPTWLSNVRVTRAPPDDPGGG